MTELATQELAQARAARIRAGIGAYVATLDDIAAAYAQRDWSALGYESWQAYVDGEYGEQRLRLTPERRQEAVGALRLAGMSQRAIGSALGVGQSTVRDDLAQLSGSTQWPDRVLGADGREHPATRPQSPAPTPEPDPEASTSTGSGPHTPDRQDPDPAPGSATPDGPADHPQSRAGAPVPVAGPAVDPTTPGVGGAIDAEVRGSAEKGDPVGSAVSPPPAPAAPVDPIDDPEFIARQRREVSSDAVAEALVAINMRLEPDPIRWLTETWIPGRYRFRDMTRVRDCFTPDGLRASAKYLDLLADHLDATGGSL